MIGDFQKILLNDQNKSIGGYFHKRKSYYFDRKDKVKKSFFQSVLQNIGSSSFAPDRLKSIQYTKRYFKLDIENSVFMYAEDEKQIDKKPQFKVPIRDIIQVKRNIISMPQYDSNGEFTEFKEVSIFDPTADLDRGPPSSQMHLMNVFEIKLTNRILTLYTPNNQLMEQFVSLLDKVLLVKEEV